jgi:hypothetical protein
MRTNLASLILICVLVSSCNNVEQNKVDSSNINNAKSNSTSAVNYNWDKSTLLMNEVLSDLNKKEKPTDLVLVKFITDFTEHINDLNEILFNDSNYDSLNTLIYLDIENIHQSALEFKEQVELSGLSIGESEGMIYIKMNPVFFKKDILSIIDDQLAVKFIQLFCNEIEIVCCEDAGFVISEKELVIRVFEWGQLLDKTSGLSFEKMAQEKYNRYLELVFHGLDNTPSFDYHSNTFNPNLFNALQEIVNKSPTSKAASVFRPFIALLVEENMKKTEKVIHYLAKVNN